MQTLPVSILAPRCFKNAFWIVSLLYPNISQTALQLFLKQKLDIGTYLRTDYQILTRDANGVVDPTYGTYVVPGILVIIFFAIGLPVMFFCVLWSVRKRLEASRRPARWSGRCSCMPLCHPAPAPHPDRHTQCREDIMLV